MTAALRPVRRLIVGTPERLGNVLDNAHRRGVLVDVTPPRRYSRGKYVVSAILLEPTHPDPAKPAVRRVRVRKAPGRYWTTPVKVGTALAALGAVSAGLVWLIREVVTLVSAHLSIIVGALALLGALAFALGRCGACSGIHCGGCRG